MLVKFVDTKKDSWQDYLESCVYAYNTSKHESTKHSPFEVMFSRKGVLPVDMINVPNCSDELQLSYSEDISFFQSEHAEHRRIQLEAVKKNILKAQAKQKEQYDRKHHKPEVFQVGSIVLKKDFLKKKRVHGKLDPKWGWSLQNNQIDWQRTVWIRTCRRPNEGCESSEWCPPQAIPHSWESSSRFKLP